MFSSSPSCRRIPNRQLIFRFKAAIVIMTAMCITLFFRSSALQLTPGSRGSSDARQTSKDINIRRRMNADELVEASYIHSAVSRAAKEEEFPDCTPQSPSVIVYNRIPKAGSTTLIALLRKMAKFNDFKIRVPKFKHNRTAALGAINAALGSDKRTVVVQHFHFPDVIDDRIAYINVMRHPVDRCVSAYHYARYGERPEGHAEASLQRFGNQTLDECMQMPEDERKCLNCPSQVQARFFCGPEGGMCRKLALDPDEMLRRALYNLKAQYTVGIVEDLSRTVDVLESLFPDYFSGMSSVLKRIPPLRVNQANAYEEPSQQTKEAVAKWSEVDMAIYDKVETDLRKLHGVCMEQAGAEAKGERGRGHPQAQR